MGDPVRVTDLTTPDWQAAVGDVGGVVSGMDDIDQCIRTILATPKGALPHHPDFGSDVWRFLDWPMDQARPQIVRDVIESISQWEPRVDVVAVSCAVGSDPTNPSLVIEITRRRKGSGTGGGTLALEVAA